jgi:hypothetical protein
VHLVRAEQGDHIMQASHSVGGEDGELPHRVRLPGRNGFGIHAYNKPHSAAACILNFRPPVSQIAHSAFKGFPE